MNFYNRVSILTRTIIAKVRKHPFYYGGGVALVLALLWFVFLRDGNGSKELLVVHTSDFAEQVSITGTVVAAQDVDLGFAQSGRIAGVYARVGQSVYQGFVIASIENGDLRAAVTQREAALAKEEAKLLSLQNGTRPEEIAVALSSVTSAESALTQANQAVINSVQDAYAKSDDAVRNKSDQFINSPRSSNPLLSFPTFDFQLKLTVENTRMVMENLLATWQATLPSLSSGNLVTVSAEVESNLRAVSAFLERASAALNLAITSSSVSQTTIDGYKTDISTARSAINTAISAFTTSLTAQKSAISSLDAAQKNLELKLAGTIQADIDAQAAQVKSAFADLTSARAQLLKTLIIAPFTGTISRMEGKVGETASPSAAIVSMISSGVFHIEAYIPEVSISRVVLGNTASTTLDAYGEEMLFGAVVISIDPAQTVRNGVSTYKTLLQFDEENLRIRSGMTANVVITTAIREGVFIIPKGALIERGGETFLALKEGNEIVERSVELGESTALGSVEIRSGLTEGDTVVLNP